MQFDPTNSSAWIKYAELETQLEDFSRTRAIFELGVSQAQISMPELLWKAYIDFETEEGEREKGRALYERLVSLSGHVKVWISYALFEAEAMPLPRSQREEEEDEEAEEVPMVEGDVTLARQVFQRGYNDLKNKGLKSEVRTSCLSNLWHVLTPQQRVALLEVWKTFEEKNGSHEDITKVEGMFPIVSRKKNFDEETGQEVEGEPDLTIVHDPHLLTTTVTQNGIWSSPTTNANPIPPPSSSFKWRTPGHRRGRLDKGHPSSLVSLQQRSLQHRLLRQLPSKRMHRMTATLVMLRARMGMTRHRASSSVVSSVVYCSVSTPLAICSAAVIVNTIIWACRRSW